MPSSTSSSPTSATGSGIQTAPTGERHIPASTRPDGTLRKEIKIRPGYRPPEDVEVYKNTFAEAWKTRGSGDIPGAATLKEAQVDEEKGGAAGKNAKRREARKKAKAAEGGEKEEGVTEDQKNPGQAVLTPRSSNKKTNGQAAAAAPAPEAEAEEDPEAEKEKQARALKKKLRQARELKEKKDSGEGLLPEQFAKVIKIQELIRQLDQLGFDSDGARKPKDVR